MPRIEVLSGEDAGRNFDVADSEQTLGRGEKCDIQIHDGSISRKHASITRIADGEFLIRDLGSTYGTFVDGRRVDEATITDGAKITLGAAQMRFTAGTSIPRIIPDDESTGPGEGSMTVVYSMTERGRELEVGDLSAAKERLRIALDVSALVSTTSDPQEMFDRLLEQTTRVIRAKRASIILWHRDRDALEAVAGRSPAGAEGDIEFSRTIVRRAVERAESMLVLDAASGSEMITSQSVFSLGIRSAMCVPIQHHEEVLGALYVDAQGKGAFGKEDLHLLKILGNIAGSAIANHRLQEQNITAARLAAIGQSMAGLAHDIKNIQAGIQGGAFMVDQGMTNSDDTMLTLGWDLVKVSQDRLNQLMFNMLDYSKERVPQYAPTDLADTLGNVRDLLAARGRDRGILVAAEVDASAKTIEAEAISIHRCVMNLGSNALDALPDTRPGRITLRARPDADASYVSIDVEDNGVGIPKEVMDKLFQAFASTKGAKGTGLGLAVSKKIAEEHRGEIVVRSVEGQGTTFTIRLPKMRAAG
ncbi:FHA domain-containing protein [bacterium]|nr:FHA domain-containing protein [bacterium]